MKCPYQTITIHKSTENYGEYITQDIITFNECLKKECPFYYTAARDGELVSHCSRTESEKA